MRLVGRSNDRLPKAQSFPARPDDYHRRNGRAISLPTCSHPSGPVSKFCLNWPIKLNLKKLFSIRVMPTDVPDDLMMDESHRALRRDVIQPVGGIQPSFQPQYFDSRMADPFFFPFWFAAESAAQVTQTAYFTVTSTSTSTLKIQLSCIPGSSRLSFGVCTNNNGR